MITCARLRLKQMWRLTKAKTKMKREHWTKRWNCSSCTKLALRTSWTHGLIAQSVRASEQNSVVVGSNPFQIPNNLSASTLYINLDKSDIKLLILNLQFCYFYKFYILLICRQKKKSAVLENVNIRLALNCDLIVALNMFHATTLTS